MTAGVAIVTGGASGIGRAIATRLARAGHAVAVLDADGTGAAATVEGVLAAGGAAEHHVVDLRGSEVEVELDVIVSRVVASLGPPAVLVNDAAVMGAPSSGSDGGARCTTADVWREVLAVNLVAPAVLTRLVADHMVAAGGGSIINIGSAGVGFGDARNIAYRASKAALESLTRSTAVELGPVGVRANCVAPGVVLSDATRRRASDEALEWLRRSRTVDEVGRPDEVAELVAFLASDAGRYANGQTWVLDGGMSIVPPWYAIRDRAPRT